MSFPTELGDGDYCPVCALGECGDPHCPSYRPKHPEVREAVEDFVIEKCTAHFGDHRTLQTYVSVGSGLLLQDWIMMERLRDVGQLPSRAIFVELRAARPLLMCEGGTFPRRGNDGGGMDLRQTGFSEPLGPEFAFSAAVAFSRPSVRGTLFEFSNGPGADAIFVEVGGPEAIGRLTFGVQVGGQCHSLPAEHCWEPSPQLCKYLFTISALGLMRVFVDGELMASGEGPPPSPVVRQHLYVGQSVREGSCFKGTIAKMQVWDHEVDWQATDLAYAYEVESAISQFAQWYAGECAVYTFGSLASYAAAAKTDSRFAADLLMKVDVHDDLDGYDDFVCQSLGPNGLALTLGGPGASWRQSGGGWCRVDSACEVLEKAEARNRQPWALLGAFPGARGRQFAAHTEPVSRRRYPAVGCRRRSLQGKHFLQAQAPR